MKKEPARDHDDPGNFGARAFEELLRRQQRRRPPPAWRDAILDEALPGRRAGLVPWSRGARRAGGSGAKPWRWFPRPLVAGVALLWAAAGMLAWDAERVWTSLPSASAPAWTDGASVPGDHPLRRHADLLADALAERPETRATRKPPL